MRWRLLFGLFVAAMFGCGEPSEETRQNRRLVDAVLTAVTTKNRRELDRDEKMLTERHSSGLLSDRAYDELRAGIERARSGDWSGAEEQLYRYRASDPFPR